MSADLHASSASHLNNVTSCHQMHKDSRGLHGSSCANFRQFHCPDEACMLGRIMTDLMKPCGSGSVRIQPILGRI